MIRKSPPPLVEGAGQIQFLGHVGPVLYALDGDPTRLRFGRARLRGSVSIDPDLAERAFRAGEGVLTLESGERLRLTMLAHSTGGADVFVEAQV